MLYVGFGDVFFDVDNHRWNDIIIANGYVRAQVDEYPA